jgi:hypothetical protein
MTNEVSKNRHTHFDLLTSESSVKWDDKWDMPTSPRFQESNEMTSSMLFTPLSIKYPMRWWMKCQVMRCQIELSISLYAKCQMRSLPLPSLSRVKWDDKLDVVYSSFFQVSDEMINEMSSNEMSNELSIPLSSKCQIKWQMRWCPFPCLPSVKWDDKWDIIHSPFFRVPNEMSSTAPLFPSVKWDDKWDVIHSPLLFSAAATCCCYCSTDLLFVAAVQLLLQRQHTLCVWFCCVTQTSLLLVYLPLSLRDSLILMTVMLLAAAAASWHVSLVARTATHLFPEDEEPCCHFSRALICW